MPQAIRPAPSAPGIPLTGTLLLTLLVAILLTIGILHTTELLAQNDPQPPAPAEADAPAEGEFAPIPPPGIVQHTGDLPEMLELHSIRVLVSFNRTNYFLDSEGRQRGFEYELMQEYEKFVNQKHAQGNIPIQIRYIPLPFARLPDSLLAGYGDVIAAQLTITPAREARMAFTEPYLTDINEVVVGHRSELNLTILEDLAGLEIHVLAGSSYLDHLETINDYLHSIALPLITITPVSEHLMEEDILEMINAGILKYTVADSHLAEAWAKVLPDLQIHQELIIHKGSRFGWAVRADSPLLLESLNAFIAEHKKGTLIGNILFDRYFENTRWITNPLTGEARTRLDRLVDLFRHYGEQYGIHWPAIAAQAYQESELDNDRRSPAGAVGIMQVLPGTAADPNVAIDNIENLENNIHAGVKYLDFLQREYFNDPEIPDDARINFAYAAYNAGPNRINTLREKAKSRGLDHRRWFSNVELLAREEIGRETVNYVRNIHKYYTAYSLLASAETLKQQDRQELGEDPTKVP